MARSGRRRIPRCKANSRSARVLDIWRAGAGGRIERRCDANWQRGGPQDAPALVGRAAQRRGQQLIEVLVDTAYGELRTRDEIERLDAEVVAKAIPRSCQWGRGGLMRVTSGLTSSAVWRAVRSGGVHPTLSRGWGTILATATWGATDCAGCRLRSQCTTARVRGRTVKVTEISMRLWRLSEQQSTDEFRARYRKRVVVEHRIAHLVQLGIRQAKYLGAAKVEFEVALAATVANLFSVAMGREPAPGSG